MTTTLAFLGAFGEAIEFIFEGRETQEGTDVGGAAVPRADRRAPEAHLAYIGVGFVNLTLALVLLAIPPVLTNTFVAVTQVTRTRSTPRAARA